jgi:hypothetical protein
LNVMRGLALGAAIVASCVVGAVPAAAAPTVGTIVLPTRRTDADQLAALGARLASQISARLGGAVVPITPASPDLATRLERAHGLLLDAQLDEAAATYDLALDTADRLPGTLAPALIVSAHVARAQIALARHEAERADALLARVVRWDDDFTATTEESTPAVHEALARLRAAGHGKPLEPADLGETCRQVDTLIVVRAAAMGAIEVARFDHCTPVAALVVRGAADEPHALERLAPAPVVERVVPPHRGLHRRPWFWIAVSAVAVSGLGVWAWKETRDEGGYDVAIHF